MAFDYEWGNRALNHGLYDRPMSYFPGSYLAARGPPSAAERRLLAPFRESLPPRLFTDAFELPRSSGFGDNRRALVEARSLFAEAGYRMRDGELRDQDDRPLSLRFVIRTANERRTLLPYVNLLARLGIRSTIRMVETAQFVNILNEGEFDVVFGNFGTGITPESGLRGRVHSSSASSALTNWAGINHPAVDSMLEKTLGARSMDELIAAARALDRVLLWNYYYIPLVGISGPLVVYWDKFGRPEEDPPFRTGFPDAWWWDEAKAQRIRNGVAVVPVRPGINAVRARTSSRAMSALRGCGRGRPRTAKVVHPLHQTWFKALPKGVCFFSTPRRRAGFLGFADLDVHHDRL